MKKKILAISGSTRQQSSNHSLLKAIQLLMVNEFEVNIFDGLSQLPHFNPDDNESEAVLHFKQQLAAADGIIICTPEYAHGVPGTLKNAIDWTVGTGEFSQKPTVLITASTDGQFAHNALLETLRVIEAGQVEQLNLLIQFIRTKVNAQHQIIHEPTLLAVRQLMNRFMETVNASGRGSE